MAAFGSKHAPEILTGLGCGGFITSLVLTAKAAPKAEKHIEEAGAETLKEKAKACYKDYVPAGITAAASVGCVVAGATVGHKRYASLATAAGLTEAAFSEYRESVKEIVGPEKEQEVAEHVKHKVENRGESTTMVLGNGKIPCLDASSGRYFQSSAIELRKIENDLNRELNDSCYISLNDFYDAIGLPNTNVGEEIGWSSNDRIDLELSSGMTPDEVPCLVVDFLKRPTSGYREFF
jgi:hypothetical protein